MQHQAAPSDVRAVLRRRADHVTRAFWTPSRYARKIGYNSVQAATNGIEFAKSKEFCKKAFEAGLRYAYLQFDGIGNDANSHRQVGNLFDVKLRAIENLHEAGVEIILVVTIVNNVNNDQVGADHQVRDGQSEEDLPSSRSSRFRSPAATRTSPPSAACASATRFRIWPMTSSSQVGTHRADARLVPDFADERLLGFRRPGARPGIALGHGELRLPPELRRRHGAHDQQGDQGMGSGAAVPERPAAGRGHAEDHRRGPRQEVLESA